MMKGAIALLPLSILFVSLPSSAFQKSPNIIHQSRPPSQPSLPFSSVQTNEAIITTRLDTNNDSMFDSFNYESQWYPVIWAVDVPLNEPVRVT
eukprot:scaffold110670_cov23-Cyclotella_meneghiniana.AAC.2